VATLRADGLRDGAGVAQAVGVEGAHDEQVDGVGEQAGDGVRLHLHVVRHRLPGAAGRLAGKWATKETKQKQEMIMFKVEAYRMHLERTIRSHAL